MKCYRAFFKYAYQEEYVEKNPMKKVGWIREGKKIIKTFTDDEVERMMKVFRGTYYLTIRNKCIMAILFDTGIRNLELCNITNKDIAQGRILIRRKDNKEIYI